MRSWKCYQDGARESLRLVSGSIPIPRPKQILLHVAATTVESADARIRALRLPREFGAVCRLAFGWRRPPQPVLGSIVAGTIAAVGSGVRGWVEGDCIVAAAGPRFGAHAEWLLLGPGQSVVRRPATVTVEHALSVAFGGIAALYFLERARAATGERILVIGATGSVGGALVQLARAQGLEVEGMSSGANLQLASELGAHLLHDYRLRPLHTLTPAGYDIVADTASASSFVECLPLLAERGRFLGIASELPAMLAHPVCGRSAVYGAAPDSVEYLQKAVDLAEAGVLRPTIDSVFGFEDLPLAHARVDSGQKRGCVLVSCLRS